MPFLRQILSDRAVTEVILLRAPRASTPFEYDTLEATVHESLDTLSALATITNLKQRQKPQSFDAVQRVPFSSISTCRPGRRMTSVQNIRRGHAEPEVERALRSPAVRGLVEEGLPVAPRFEVLRRVDHGQNDSFFRVDVAAVVDPTEFQRARGRRGHTITGDGEHAAV